MTQLLQYLKYKSSVLWHYIFSNSKSIVNMLIFLCFLIRFFNSICVGWSKIRIPFENLKRRENSKENFALSHSAQIQIQACSHHTRCIIKIILLRSARFFFRLIVQKPTDSQKCLWLSQTKEIHNSFPRFLPLRNRNYSHRLKKINKFRF